MSDKRKLTDIFPLSRVTRLKDKFPVDKTRLNDLFPYRTTGLGSGFLNPLTIEQATPVYNPPVPSFSATTTGFVALSSNNPPDSVTNVGTLGEVFTLSNTTDGTTYTSLLWSVTEIEKNTALPTSNYQNYTISPLPDANALSMSWRITLQAFFHNVQGTAYMELHNTLPPLPPPSITFNSVATTYTTQQTPTGYVSSTNTTALTFTNTTASSPSWDNSVLTCTVDSTPSTTSTTGSISVSITANSLTPANIIVVREDIYKGTTLRGTTYSNVSFTSTYFAMYATSIQVGVVPGTFLQLSEVQAFSGTKNVAAASNGGTASATSVYISGAAVPANAIDGSLTGLYPNIYHGNDPNGVDILTVSFARATISTISLYGRAEIPFVRNDYSYRLFDGTTLVALGTMDCTKSPYHNSVQLVPHAIPAIVIQDYTTNLPLLGGNLNPLNQGSNVGSKTWYTDNTFSVLGLSRDANFNPDDRWFTVGLYVVPGTSSTMTIYYNAQSSVVNFQGRRWDPETASVYMVPNSSVPSNAPGFALPAGSTSATLMLSSTSTGVKPGINFFSFQTKPSYVGADPIATAFKINRVQITQFSDWTIQFVSAQSAFISATGTTPTWVTGGTGVLIAGSGVLVFSVVQSKPATLIFSGQIDIQKTDMTWQTIYGYAVGTALTSIQIVAPYGVGNVGLNTVAIRQTPGSTNGVVSGFRVPTGTGL